MGMERFAAIDIGTVTSRLLVADVDGGQVRDVVRAYEVTNLGEGTDATGRLNPNAIDRVASALDGFLRLRDEASTPSEPVIATVAVTTSAARDASNAEELRRIFTDRGLSLEVIDGKTEAALTFRGVSAGTHGEDALMVVDVGGGSTEISFGYTGCPPDFFRSFDVGCRRLTERFFKDDPPCAADIKRASAWVDGQIIPWAATLPAAFASARLFAVAGTATSAISMHEHLETYDAARVHGARLSLDALQTLLHRLALLSEWEREQVTGLDPRRAPVIVAGLLILSRVMEAFNVGEFTASESDILQGMILWAAQHHGRSR